MAQNIDKLKQKLAEKRRVISAEALVLTREGCLQAALAYAAMGYNVIPLHSIVEGICTCRDKSKCKHPGKHPRSAHGLSDATLDENTIRAWWLKWPDANVGIATGEASNLVVVDIDPRHGGDESLKKLDPFPDTLIAKTGGGGLHYCFTHPGQKVKSGSDVLGRGIDTRGDGGYIVAPPSKHASGASYEWQNLVAPADCPISLYGNAAAAKGNIIEGQRDNTLASLAGALRREGKNADEIYEELCRINREQCIPPLPENELRRIADSIGRYAAGHWIVNYHCTDSGNAQLFAHLYGNRLRFDHSRNRWLLWKDNYWSTDTDGEVSRLTEKLARARHALALKIEDSDLRGAQAKWALKSEEAPKRAATERLSRSLSPITDEGKNWDSNAWLLGTQNGVFDLKTCTHRPGEQSDRITKRIAVAYDPIATCPRWEQFVEEITQDDDLSVFMQRFLGMCLTGDIREQYLFVFYGTGDNGKNVLLDTVCGIMGEYAKSAPPDLLTYRAFDPHPTEIADLCGARLVIASETEENKMLRVALVKNLTGDATLKGRYMRQDYFEFPRTHKLVLVTNNRPVVRENSHAIWRRIRLLPFNVTIPPEKQDKELLTRLHDEWPGILNWLIAGCTAWQQNGLGMPNAVSDATASYREEQDLLANFIADYCHYDEAGFAADNDLYDEYTRWAQETHEKYPLHRNVFFQRIKMLQGVTHVQEPQRGFKGIAINLTGI